MPLREKPQVPDASTSRGQPVPTACTVRRVVRVNWQLLADPEADAVGTIIGPILAPSELTVGVEGSVVV